MKSNAVVGLLLVISGVALAQETSEFQRLRGSYDTAVQRAVRPMTEAYLKELNRLRDLYASAGRKVDVQQVEDEIKLVSEKLAAMSEPGAASLGHRTVVMDVRAAIPANSPEGYSLGAVRQGDVITLQYLDGKWKSHGHIPTNNPDEDGNQQSDDSRLVIARAPVNGKPGEVITTVPLNTKTKPYSYTVATTRDEVVLRINKNSDDHGNPGSVVYQVKILR